MNKKLALLALPLALMLTACGGSSEPTPSPSETVTPTPTETALPVDPSASTVLAGSTFEPLWQSDAVETSAIYNKSKIVASRIFYPDGKEDFTFYFPKDSTLVKFSQPSLECSPYVFKTVPLTESLGIPDKEDPNSYIYVGQDEPKLTPNGYLATNTLLISSFTSSTGASTFIVNVTLNDRLAETYVGTYFNMKPLEAVTALSKLNYTATFGLMDSQNTSIKFTKIYQHTYRITDIIDIATVKQGQSVANSAIKYYTPTEELLYNFDRVAFYQYNFEKNTLKAIGDSNGYLGCELPKE